MKARNDDLFKIANDVLIANDEIWLNKTKGTILDSYNGQIAALPFSVRSQELLSALAIYYQDKPKAETKRKANRRTVLNIVAQMLAADTEMLNALDSAFSNAKGRLKYVYTFNDNDQEQTKEVYDAEALLRGAIDKQNLRKLLAQEVIECSIALKHIVRTYKLVENEQA
ncbi:MAG: hypothetical protein LBC89_02675 [Bacteroidales bacterium]|jgi:hypothetical protein|nr:hypothetical protein [Bacteroidales bacterium]